MAQAVILAAAGVSVFLAGGPGRGPWEYFWRWRRNYARPSASQRGAQVELDSGRIGGGLRHSVPAARQFTLHARMAPEFGSPSGSAHGINDFRLPAGNHLLAPELRGSSSGRALPSGTPVRFPATLWLAVAAAAVCAAYAGLAVYASSTGWKYPFFEENGYTRAGFGFFPNRNQTATFLVTGCILCPGIIATGWKSRCWAAMAAGAAALAINAGALFFFSSSRGGIVFLFLGLILWLSGLGRAHSSCPLWISVFSLTSMAVAFFLLSDGPARDRILALVGKSAPATQMPACSGCVSEFQGLRRVREEPWPARCDDRHILMTDSPEPRNVDPRLHGQHLPRQERRGGETR